LLLTFLVGCGGEEPTPGGTTAQSPAQANGNSTPQSANNNSTAQTAPRSKPPRISLGGNSTPESNGTDSPAANGHPVTTPAEDEKTKREAVLTALQPLQILRDEWNIIQQAKAGSEDAVQNQSWIWDFKRNRAQPALVMHSPKGTYLQEARLTFDAGTDTYEMEAVTPEGETRKLTGEFVVPVAEIQGEDNKLHRTYKLQFTQTQPADSRDAFQIVINQQSNNRYLMEISKKRGSGFVRVDTLGAQRMGTNFGLVDTGYGERTCVVSGGLGTTAVSFMGKTYYVCCSGCKAAFDDDAATWVAEYEAKKNLSP